MTENTKNVVVCALICATIVLCILTVFYFSWR